METIIFNFAPLQGGHDTVILPYPELRLTVSMNFHAFVTLVEEYLNRHSYSYLPVARAFPGSPWILDKGKRGSVLEGENVRIVWRACQRIGLVDPLDTRVPITLVHVEEN